MSYLDELSRELAAVGVAGALRRRVIAEIGDHLHCDPTAELGPPAELARRFANELGTERSLRAAFAVFGALALAGVLFAIAFATEVSGFPHRQPHSQLLATAAAALVGLGAQVGFVAGALAAVRALRRRGALVLPRAAASVVVRRAGVALAAGLMATGGLALLAIEYDRGGSGSSTTLALMAAAAGTAALAAAAPAVVRAARLRPIAGGPAGDVFDDLGRLTPPPLHGRPWPFALVVAASLAAIVTFAGILQSDPYDGALRGIADALACLGCFAALGRYLGLRRT